MRVATSDSVARLHHFPFFILFARRALDQGITAPFEATQPPRRAQSFELPSARRRGRPGNNEAGSRTDSAVAVYAIDFNRGTRFAVNFSIAVIVLPEMAIGALHSFFRSEE